MQKISKLISKPKLQLFISTLGVLALIAFSSLIVFEAMKKTVVINNNGEAENVQTHAETVAEVLDETGITVSEHDELSHDLNDEIENGMTIDYDTAKQVVVNIDGEEQIYYTTLDKIEDFILHHNLTSTHHDELSHDLDDEIKEGMEIEINKAFQVPVVNAGKEKKYWTTGGTVEQFLNQHQITYHKNSEDKLNVALSDEVDKDTEIKIVRIEKTEKKVKEAVPFETEVREDDSMEKGKEKVISEGEEGLVTKIFEVTNEDGKETDENLVDTKVEKESKNRVVVIGTKENSKPKLAPKKEGSNNNIVTVSNNKSNTKKSNKQTSNNHSDSGRSGGKSLSMSASAYTAGCSGCSGYTSTGIDLNANPNMKVVAVDPSVIPLGTKVWVEGYGEAVAADTGGNIKGNRIDLHFPTKEAAYSFGQRTVTVKILD